MTSVEGYTAPYKIKMHPTTINNISWLIFLVSFWALNPNLLTQSFSRQPSFARAFQSRARAAAENGLAVMNTESTSNDHHWQFTRFNSLLKNCKPINYTMQ